MCRIRLELYATRSTRDLLVLGLLLLLLVITVKFHCFAQPNSSASYEEILRMQDIFKIFYSALLVGLVREAAAGTFGLQPVVMIKSLPRKCVGPLMVNTESHVGYRQPHLQEHLLVKSL